MTRKEAASAPARHFLLLQGPCGSFYRELQHDLQSLGHRCTRVVINGGDLVNARFGRKLIFRRAYADWPAWLKMVTARDGVTDVVLYGDCRPYHRAAIAALEPAGVTVHVLEEGYLRPNWITCEKSGVNGNSRLILLDLSRIDPAAVGSAPPPETELQATQGRYMLAGITYYFWSTVLTPLFPRYVSHRDLDTAGEAVLWLWRFATWPRRNRDTQRALQAIERLGKPVHLVLLQLNGNSQIKEHSAFRSVRHFVEFCIAEFAASGIGESLLVFKNHPLDNGVINLARLIREEAARRGLRNRVFFIDTGKLVPLLERATSVAAINSTACHQALRRGIPTLVLGKAVYNHPETVPRMRLSDFFRLRPVGDTRRYELLVGLLRQTCQINGGYYGKMARRAALPALCRLLTGGGRPLETFLRADGGAALERPKAAS